MSSPVIDEILQKARDLFASAAPQKPAIATTLGSVKLRGDLGGTADAPTVPALEEKASLGPDGKVLASQLPDGTGGGGGPVDWSQANTTAMMVPVLDPETGEPTGENAPLAEFVNGMYGILIAIYTVAVGLGDRSEKYERLVPMFTRLDSMDQLSSQGYVEDALYFAVADDGSVTFKVPGLNPKGGV